MPSQHHAPETRLLRLWQTLQAWPGGRWLFSRYLGHLAPYSGSIHAQVLDCRAGFASISLRDRRRLRNHLRSIHALAILNLAELTSGLAMLISLPTDVHGIITGLQIDYLKKARGTLKAQSHCAPPVVEQNTDYEVGAEVFDAQGDLVARARVRWRLSLRT